MTTCDLLDELTRRGVRLSVVPDGLRFDAPKGTLTPDLLAELKAHKKEIIAHLTRTTDYAPPIPEWPPWTQVFGRPLVQAPPVRCPDCGCPRFWRRADWRAYRCGRCCPPLIEESVIWAPGALAEKS